MFPQGIISRQLYLPPIYSTSVLSAVSLAVNFGNLLLEYGVDLNVKKANLRGLQVSLPDHFFSQCVFNLTVNEPKYSPLLKCSCDHLLCLLAHGAIITETSFPCLFSLILNSNNTKVEASNTLSLMPNSTRNQFRKFITEKMHSDCQLSQESSKSLQDFLNTGFLLKEHCRYVMYSCIPNRRMAAYAKRLPLPVPLQQYLSFGYSV